MTDSQRTNFYIPAWLEIQSKADWRMVGGRLAVDLNAQLRAAENFPAHARDAVQAIISSAQNVAQAERRAVVADDLRKGCNRLASGGRTDSSRKFGRTDFNHFDRLRAVIAGPWDLTATIAWMNPEEDDRKRTLVYLRKIANEGRLRAIALNTWATHDIDTLTQAQLDSLTAEIRKGAWPKYPKAKRQPQMLTD